MYELNRMNRIIKQNLNMGHDVLEDVLVLRVENDQDYYIHMKGNYIMSCFGQSLEHLIRMKQPGTSMNDST